MTKQRLVVVGNGMAGARSVEEVLARGLLSHGCAVTVVHLGQHLMEAQTGPTGGGMLKTAMEKMGVKVALGMSTTAVLGEQRVEGLTFKDGTSLPDDLLVVAAGIRPNAEIGRAAGLTVERAIVVDNQMRSVDDMNVYVVGECAQHRGMVYGLVAPLWDQAKVFADHVTARDRDAAYHGSELATKRKVMGVELVSMGLRSRRRSATRSSSSRKTRRCIITCRASR